MSDLRRAITTAGIWAVIWACGYYLGFHTGAFAERRFHGTTGDG